MMNDDHFIQIQTVGPSTNSHWSVNTDQTATSPHLLSTSPVTLGD